MAILQRSRGVLQRATAIGNRLLSDQRRDRRHERCRGKVDPRLELLDANGLARGAASNSIAAGSAANGGEASWNAFSNEYGGDYSRGIHQIVRSGVAVARQDFKATAAKRFYDLPRPSKRRHTPRHTPTRKMTHSARAWSNGPALRLTEVAQGNVQPSSAGPLPAPGQATAYRVP
jgi:hypothetical protein